MTLHAKEMPSLPQDVILEQLNKVLSNQLFKGSVRSTKLLRFLVEQTVGGQSGRLKEYTVGTEALGKGHSFDPRTDPSVRSEASRLRARLDKYYATEGQTDPIVIALPQGGYVPRFESRAARPGGSPRVAEESPRSPFRLHVPLAILAGTLIAATALISYAGFAFLSRPQGIVAERVAAASQANAVSIAVLPFLNLSGDASQEFFSDGVTEEITAALAKVPDLKIVARTSAFQFRAQNRDIQSIGQQLHATHLIEGSVRKEGSRVRITAQLIDAANGVRVSSETYDRELSDIFTTQEDIARTIVGALMAPLGLAPGQNLVSNRNIDPETYQQYLRAKALVRARGIGPLTDGAALLEQVVANHPQFAPAWALLANAYDVMPAYHSSWVNSSIEELHRVVDASLPRAEMAAQQAVQLDPNSPDGYVSLALAHQLRGQFLPAEEFYSKARALDPNGPEVLHTYSLFLSEVGRVKEALAMRQELQLLDPFVPVFNGNTAVIYWLNGQTDAAIAMLNDLPQGDAFRGFYLPRIYAASGRYAESVAALWEAPFAYLPGKREQAARLLGTAPKLVASVQSLPPLGNMEFVFLHIGAPNRALEFYEDNLKVGYSLNIATSFLWHASYGAVRKTERFKAYARKLGLVEYWRSKGWPEFCHPTTGDDFACD